VGVCVRWQKAHVKEPSPRSFDRSRGARRKMSAGAPVVPSVTRQTEQQSDAAHNKVPPRRPQRPLSLCPQLPCSPSRVPCVSGHSFIRSSVRSCVFLLSKQWPRERSTLVASRNFCLSLPLSVSRRIHPGFQQQCMQCSRSSEVAERIHV